MWWYIGRQIGRATGEIANQRVSATEPARRDRRLEPAHRPHAAFQKPLIALETIIEVFGAPMLDCGNNDAQGRRITLGFITGHTGGLSLGCARSKEALAAAVSRRSLE